MSLFNTFCENYLEEMSAPRRGAVGIPKSAVKTPGFAAKEKFGTQAGKYTGGQMLNFLGEFLTDNGDRALDYSEIQKLLDTFLKRKGFGGTAAKYWTRTLGQAIYDFGYQPEKPSEITDGKGEQPEEFEADEVPEIVDSEEVSGGGEGEDEEPTAEEPKPPASQEAEEDVLEDYWTKKVYEYIKDGGETPTSEEDVTGYIQKRAAQVRDSEAENKEFVVRKIEILVSKGLLKKEGEGYVAVEKEIEQKEGEGTGEVDTFDREGDERDYGAEDTINKYASQWGERPEFGSQYENFDMMKAFSEIFKSNSRE